MFTAKETSGERRSGFLSVNAAAVNFPAIRAANDLIHHKLAKISLPDNRKFKRKSRSEILAKCKDLNEIQRLAIFSQLMFMSEAKVKF